MEGPTQEIESAEAPTRGAKLEKAGLSYGTRYTVAMTPENISRKIYEG